MLMSETYRQSSVHSQQAEYGSRDFENRLWWRAERRRLDAEALRDAMLFASGQLDLAVGGPSFRPTIHPEALEGLSRKSGAWTASAVRDQNRRGLYIFTQRSLLVPMMTTFNFCDTTLPCAARDVTNVAPQALALLNNAFVHRQDQLLAERVIAEAGDDVAARVNKAWRLTFGRLPADSELSAAVSHLDEQTSRFERWIQAQRRQPAEPMDVRPVSDGLVLDLRADRGLTLDGDGRVATWEDASGRSHHAHQAVPASRPVLIRDAVNAQPAIRFDGVGSFLHLTDQVLSSQRFTMFAVASDDGSGSHREILSNWNAAADNSVTSVFLGTTGPATVRFSDNFSSAGDVRSPREHFLLTAVSSDYDATVFQNQSELSHKGTMLAARNLKAPYVIGRQGSLNGEYWNGDIAEILVYNRALSDDERKQVTRYLMQRYGLEYKSEPPPDANVLALASLCHVLLNANEFIFVD
jgi:hypothetical protein